MKRRNDADSPWKEILDVYFEEFICFFFPLIDRETDWKQGYTVLDKELKQITREAETGRRLADKLIRVAKKNGEETWVLVHIEIQAQKQTDFAHRTYIYNYRIHDLYNRHVASLAILTDKNPEWYPSEYCQELWGCGTEFHFPVIKILDYKDKTDMLEKSDNPFAVVIVPKDIEKYPWS